LAKSCDLLVEHFHGCEDNHVDVDGEAKLEEVPKRLKRGEPRYGRKDPSRFRKIRATGIERGQIALKRAVDDLKSPQVY